MEKIKIEITNWISKNRIEFFVLIFILAVASFYRLYRIADYMTFLGDEGRDVILVRRLLVDFDPILIGPGTSIGNMYLGPLYYYMMAPALLAFNFSPVGPAVMIAVLGVITVGLVWFIGNEWFGRPAGIFAAVLFALAPTVVVYSRSSWNPNIMPFFSLVSIYGIWRLWQNREYYWLPVVGASFAFVLNSHYLGLLLGIPLGLFWLATIYDHRKANISYKKLTNFSIIALVLFLFLMSPLVIFDARHGWINSKAMYEFFSKRQTTVSARPWNALPAMWPQTQEITTRLLTARDEFYGNWAAIGLIGIVLWAFTTKKFNITKKETRAFLLVTVWLGGALLGLGLYKQHIYDHYYGFFFAAPFLLLGGALAQLIEKHKVRGWWIAGTAMLFLVFINLQNNALKIGPVMQLNRTKEIAMSIEEKAGSDKFNLAVIAERNYEDAYQYFLEKDHTGVTDIDALRSDETITDRLFVVCEMEESKCDPTHNSKAEVANFGWSKIEDQWNIGGITIYELSHSIPPEDEI